MKNSNPLCMYGKSLKQPKERKQIPASNFFFYSLTKVEKTRKTMYVIDESAETLFSFTPGKQVSWYHLLT